jgi:hypothetical protein
VKPKANKMMFHLRDTVSPSTLRSHVSSRCASTIGNHSLKKYAVRMVQKIISVRNSTKQRKARKKLQTYIHKFVSCITSVQNRRKSAFQICGLGLHEYKMRGVDSGVWIYKVRCTEIESWMYCRKGDFGSRNKVLNQKLSASD